MGVQRGIPVLPTDDPHILATRIAIDDQVNQSTRGANPARSFVVTTPVCSFLLQHSAARCQPSDKIDTERALALYQRHERLVQRLQEPSAGSRQPSKHTQRPCPVEADRPTIGNTRPVTSQSAARACMPPVETADVCARFSSKDEFVRSGQQALLEAQTFRVAFAGSARDDYFEQWSTRQDRLRTLQAEIGALPEGDRVHNLHSTIRTYTRDPIAATPTKA